MDSWGYLPPISLQSETIYKNCTELHDRHTKEIIVSNFDEKTTIKDLCIRFSVYGNIKDLYLLPDLNSDRRACIIFCEVQSTVRTLEEGKKSPIYLHDKELRVCAKLIKNDTEGRKELEIYLENHRGNISINSLNDDCLLRVFGYLSIREIYKLKKVCTRWYTITDILLQSIRHLNLDIYLFGVVKTGYVTLNNGSLTLKKVQLLSNESALNATRISLDDAPFLKELLTDFKHLFTLIITLVIKDEYILSSILTINQELRHIEIYGNNFITGKSLIHLSEKIHTFIVEGCSNLKSDHLCTALKRLKNLKHFKWWYCPGYDILNILKKNCKNLVSLHLLFWGLDYKDVNALLSITKLRNLRDLRICSSDGITDIFLTELRKNCQELRHLELSNCNSVGEIGISAITALPKLLVIHLFGLSSLHGFTNLRKLQELDCRCSHIREEQIVNVVKNSPELRYLGITSCRYVTRNILSKIQTISASRCNDITLELCFNRDIKKGPTRVIHNGQIY